MLNESVKQRMRVDTQRLFRMKQILLYGKFYSKTPDCKAELIAQINNYRVEWREARPFFHIVAIGALKRFFVFAGERHLRES